MVSQKDFWSQVSPKYDETVDAQLGDSTRSLIREKLSAEGRLGTAVEFGCGTGFLTGVLAGKADSLVATDLAEGMLQRAKENVKGHDNVRFEMADCQNTAFPDMAFDTAVMSLVLHFTDADRTLAEMRRILKPGGTLIIANMDSTMKIRYKIALLIRTLYHSYRNYSRSLPREGMKNMMSSRRLCGKLEKAGFRVERVEMMRDASRASNPVIDYIKAVKT